MVVETDLPVSFAFPGRKFGKRQDVVGPLVTIGVAEGLTQPDCVNAAVPCAVSVAW